jgi:hypothetical protein
MQLCAVRALLQRDEGDCQANGIKNELAPLTASGRAISLGSNDLALQTNLLRPAEGNRWTWH